MGNAPGKGPNGLHFLGLLKLVLKPVLFFFHPLQITDVYDDAPQACRLVIPCHEIGVDHNGKFGAVFSPGHIFKPGRYFTA